MRKSDSLDARVEQLSVVRDFTGSVDSHYTNESGRIAILSNAVTCSVTFND